jgi:hypothetical protein
MLDDLDFEWTKAPWFLAETCSGELWAHRYEREELEAAGGVLATLYPPSFCREYFTRLQASQSDVSNFTDANVRRRRMERGLGQLLLGLLMRWGVRCEALALGIDVARVLPQQPPPSLLARLKEPLSVVGTAFEFELWANALRAGLTTSRIPEGRGKTPDFLLSWNGRRIAMEAKDLATGEDEMMMFEHLPFFHFQVHAPEDRTYHIELNEEIRRRVESYSERPRYRAQVEAVVDAFDSALQRLENAGWPIGNHAVPEYGHILVDLPTTDRPGGSSSVNLAADPRPWHQARRALEPIRDGARKFLEWPRSGAEAAIIVIDTPMYDQTELHHAIANEVRDNAEAYLRTDGVILRRRALRADGDPARAFEYYVCLALRFPSSALSESDLVDLAGTILASPHRLLAPVRHLHGPDPIPSVSERMVFSRTTIQPD